MPDCLAYVPNPESPPAFVPCEEVATHRVWFPHHGHYVYYCEWCLGRIDPYIREHAEPLNDKET